MLIKYLLLNIFRNTDVDSLTLTHVHESKLHNRSYDKLYKKYSTQNGLYFPFIRFLFQQTYNRITTKM